MVFSKWRRTFIALLLLFALLIVYLTILKVHSYGPNTRYKLMTGRWFVMTEQHINASTDRLMSSNNVTETSNNMSISNKPVIINKPVVNEQARDIQLPDPPLKPDESGFAVDVNIDRVYGCGRKSMSLVRPKEERIPRIIHFMWKTENIPSVFVDNLKTFVRHNPTWTYYFWTDNSTDLFIKEKYPNLHKTFQGYPIYVSRYDAARYAIVHYYGGAYFDLDTINFKSLDPLLETEECILTSEPMEHAAVVLHWKSVLGNCVFLCKPKHSFFTHVLKELDGSKHVNDMMRAAGPIFFTRALRTYVASCLQGKTSSNESIHVMSGEYFLDYLKKDVKEDLLKICKDKNPVDPATGESRVDACASLRKRNSDRPILSPKAYSVHLYFSTYFNKKLLDQRPENNIKNIIPNVKMYPS